jgi:hypothetical protein
MPGEDQFSSLADANIHLLKKCEEINKEEISNKTIPEDEFKIEQQHMLPYPPRFECCIKSDNRVDKYATVIAKLNHYSVPDTLVGKMVSVKLYADTIVIYYEGVVVAAHNRSYSKHDWVIDIMHYLRTLSKKPGALKRSSALLQADTKIKNLYTKHYSKDAKTFLQVLEIIKTRGIDKVMEAIQKLEKISPEDMSYDKVLTLCDFMQEQSANVIFISDHLTELHRKSLSGYDMLFDKAAAVNGGVLIEG